MDVVNGRKGKLKSDHPDTFTSMANLASTYRNQGRWDEAQKLDVTNARKTTDYPDTLTSMTNLASRFL
ncbi:hypothetical protein F5887DRAFT_1076645 [Amanita rubescens]|nr:hypothetical protein F5887DRAFT_1078366 [Amanita rubescens]KAF8341078.1 hypothetical protein F5887DRAFT_1076645 [Amanita rubescens]